MKKGGENGVEEKLAAKNTGDPKRLMAENTAKTLKVWYSFVKFIKNQVTVNGRLVDTQMIGLFGKDSNDNLIYLPSRDYLEAGKFKLQRGPGSLVSMLNIAEGADFLDNYSAKYAEKLEVSVTTQNDDLVLTRLQARGNWPSYRSQPSHS